MLLKNKFPVFLALCILSIGFHEQALATKKSYVVYLGEHSHDPDVTTNDLHFVADSHHQLLSSFVGSEKKAKDAIFYSYDRHINGFAALLEEEEAAEIAKHPAVISVFENKAKKLHTTRSWDFMLLEKNGVIHPSSLWKKARFGEDTIIGTLDTGVWPESESFSDKEIEGPIPSKWKGECHFDDKSLCNRKLIGARYFNKGYLAREHIDNSTFKTPRDLEGHGSHTLSTAGGGFVRNANIAGLGMGTTKGGSPKARVASYKVCWPKIPNEDGTCFDADILKAFDMAIHDGVDVMSVSLGGTGVVDYFNDGLAIGSFHAVKNGVVVVASAGNDGPKAATVTNVAPWIITVGASTIDRDFRSDVKLGNGNIIQGTSLSPALDNKFYPLISGAQAKAANASADDAMICKEGTLDSQKVNGRILVCLRGGTDRVNKGKAALDAGAVGMILCNTEKDGNDLYPDPHILPATHINSTFAEILYSYVNTSSKPKGLLMHPTSMLHTKPNPNTVYFTSRGPNLLNPEILKPDVTAPGVNIIAAFSGSVGVTVELWDTRTTPFNIMSGTSMACPHVAGVVSLIKTLYPYWSPAAIRSALMTTARVRDNTNSPMLAASVSNAFLASDFTKATPFEYGSGHIQPNRVMHPGLVYDLSANDYLDFLCGVGYNQTLIKLFGGSSYNCPKNYSLLSFNNPSISVPNLTGSVTFTRKVKNLDTPGTYFSRIRQPAGYSVSVEPKILTFEKIGEEKSFEVTIVKTRKLTNVDQTVIGHFFGELIWSDGVHYVRSPIVVSDADQ